MVIAIAIPLSLVGTYAFISVVMFRFPHVLHKKKKHGVKASLIAHRGGAGENLENTMTAFQHSIDRGMDMLELDCQLTKDGHVVVSHDNVIERTTGHDILISETNYEDLPCIQRQLKVTFSKDKWCHSQSEDCQIPLLSNVFNTFPDVAINLDIKEDDVELIDKVLEMIWKFDREEITVVGNFRESVTSQVRKKAPKIPTIFSMSNIAKLMLLCYTGLLPFVPLKDSFLEIPVARFLKREVGVDIFPWYVKILVKVYDTLLIRQFLFKHLQRRGVKVYLWVLNHPEEWEHAMSLGIDGVMTDYPTALRAFMDENEYKFPAEEP